MSDSSDSLDADGFGTLMDRNSVICPVCCEKFKSPRLLFCLHPLCETCIQRSIITTGDRDIVMCPLCKQKTQLDENGVHGLVFEVLTNRMAEDKPTEVYGTCCHSKSPAAAYCQECTNYLCQSCIGAHKSMHHFSTHEVKCLQSAGSPERPLMCQRHPSEMLKKFCLGCELAFCDQCMEHRLHKWDHIVNVAEQQRQTLVNMMDSSKNQLEAFEDAEFKLQSMLGELGEQKKQCAIVIEETYLKHLELVKQAKEAALCQLDQATTASEERVCKAIDCFSKVSVQIQECGSYADHVLAHATLTELLVLKKAITQCLVAQYNAVPKQEDVQPNLTYVPHTDSFKEVVARTFGHVSRGPAQDQLELELEAADSPPIIETTHQMRQIQVSAQYPQHQAQYTQPQVPVLSSSNVQSGNTAMYQHHNLQQPPPPHQFTNYGMTPPPIGTGMRLPPPPPPPQMSTFHGWQQQQQQDAVGGLMSRGLTPGAGFISVGSRSPQSDSGISTDGTAKHTGVIGGAIPKQDGSAWAYPGLNPDAQFGQLVAAEGRNLLCSRPDTPSSGGGRLHGSMSQVNVSGGLLQTAHSITDLEVYAAKMAEYTPPSPALTGASDSNMRNEMPSSPDDDYISPANSGQYNSPGSVLGDLNNPPFPNRKNHTPMQIRHKFGQHGPARGQFNGPHGFCMGMDEEIVVADTNNHRIQVFDKSGEYRYQFGVPGREEGQLWYPRKVAVMRTAGKYVICDRGNERSRMQIFTNKGQFVKKIAIRYIDIVAGLAINADGCIVAVDSVSPTVFVINEAGHLVTWFDCSNYMKEPSDIAIKSREYYVCDFKGHCVVVFDQGGTFQRRIGCEGVTNFPNGIDISEAGDVLVGDSHGNRFHVAVFSREGSLIGEFECPYVKVSRCCGLKITSEGYVVTLAKNNHHVLVLNTLYIPQDGQLAVT